MAETVIAMTVAASGSHEGARDRRGRWPVLKATELQTLAYMYLSDGSLQQAARICDFYLQVHAPDAGILGIMTAVYAAQGEYEAAHRLAHRWVEACPADAWAHYYLGLAEVQRGRCAEAQRRLELACRLNGADAALMSRCLHLLSNLDTIQLRQIRALWRVDPSFVLALQRSPQAALTSRGFSLSQEALESLQLLVRSAPNL